MVDYEERPLMAPKTESPTHHPNPEYAKVTIIVETSEGIQTMIVPEAEWPILELKTKEPVWVGPRRFGRPEIDRIIVSLRPVPNKDGLFYTLEYKEKE